MILSSRSTFSCLAILLCGGCAVIPKPPEKLSEWMNRSTSAWTAMQDDGKPVPSLDRSFVQAGMSTSSALVFVVVPGTVEQAWSVKSVEAIDKGPLSASEYQVTELRVGGTVRVEVSRLAPAQRYRVAFALGQTEELVESRTAPELSEPTSVVLVSCNEPWNRSRPDGLTVGVPAAAASALRTLDLRTAGVLPVELGREDGSVQRFERATFLIGLGDQAYVDAEPNEEGSLALFAGARSNQLRVAISEPGQWPQVLARIYRMHFLIPSFHRALSSLPSAMVWDDHEIRDGWGSQRDESGPLPQTQLAWKDYFAAARKMTWELEVARNPNAGGQAITAHDESLDRELDTSFAWGDRLQVFLLDTRTHRGRTEGAVMSDAQLERVRAWFLPCGAKPSVFMLGIPIPLSVNHDNQVTAAGAALQSELEDDVVDGWWATVPAQAMRIKLETVIADHAARCADDRIVLLSGDVHESGLIAVSREKKTIAYEVISSGIASMVLNGALSRAILATRTEYYATSDSGVSYSGIGRISTGSSFAEIFFEFPEGAPPRIRTLFYPTTAIDLFVDNTLINVGTTLKGTTWKTGTTRVGQLAAGVDLKSSNAAIELEYGIRPPNSGDYAISQAALRCTTDMGVFSNGARIDQLATDWSTLFQTPHPCRDVSR